MSVSLRVACLFGAFASLTTPVLAAGELAKDVEPTVGPVTGRELPRFASLKSRSVNMRVGPGTQYAISWQFQRPSLPVKIVGEHGNWRQISDSSGATGWVLHSLLLGRRTAIVAPWSAGEGAGDGIANLISTAKGAAPLLDAYRGPSRDEPVRAKLQAGLVVKVKRCDARWCAVEVRGREAWLPQSALWGVKQGERFGK